MYSGSGERKVKGVGHPRHGGETETGSQRGEGLQDMPAILSSQNLLLPGMHMSSLPSCLLVVPFITMVMVKTLQ